MSLHEYLLSHNINKPLICSRDDWQYNAIVNSARPYDEFDEWRKDIQGFRLAAEVTVEAVGDLWRPARQFETFMPADYVYRPVMFNYRQSLESAIKCLILQTEHFFGMDEERPWGHDLEKLWGRLRPNLLQFVDDTEILRLESVVKEFTQVDPGGDAFRYPVDGSGGQHLKGIGHINLQNVKEIMSEVLDVLIYAIEDVSETQYAIWEGQSYTW